jgi:hypothetical protein
MHYRQVQTGLILQSHGALGYSSPANASMLQPKLHGRQQGCTCVMPACHALKSTWFGSISFLGPMLVLPQYRNGCMSICKQVGSRHVVQRAPKVQHLGLKQEWVPSPVLGDRIATCFYVSGCSRKYNPRNVTAVQVQWGGGLLVVYVFFSNLLNLSAMPPPCSLLCCIKADGMLGECSAEVIASGHQTVSNCWLGELR